jgi:long-chain acyl-CoA synthetase
MEGNVGQFLHGWTRREPKRIAMVDAGRNDLALSFAALDREAGRVGARLRELGLGAGDRVLIYTKNGLDFVAAWFGAVYAGCTTLPMTSGATERELAFVLNHAGCKALLSDEAKHEEAEAALVRAGSDARLLGVERARHDARGQISPAVMSAGALAMILYTSGTTGAAKGVCVTHESLLRHTHALVEHSLRLGEQDRVLGTLPLTHSYGIRMTLLAPFCAGARSIFVPRFSPSLTLQLCEAHGVTWLPGVPTMFVAWASETGARPIETLRWCLSAGAPLVEDARLGAEERLGATVRQGYGLTEATFSTINSPDDVAAPGSVGKPVKNVEIRIANEQDATLPSGSHGQVLVRGPNVMAGYLDDPTATRHVMRGGWLHTGDIGFLDEAGRLTVVDRIKDLILRGGHSIYPSELENVIADHPLVRSVAVVGQSDPYYGEEVVAIIIPRQPIDLAELQAWMRERLASHKLPRRIAFTDSMPQSGSGKTLKRQLRQQIETGELQLSILEEKQH